METNVQISPKTHVEQTRTVTILGSTGTIGCQTLDVLSHHQDQYSVKALTAQNNVELLARQAIECEAEYAVIGNEEKYQELKSLLAHTNIEASAGETAILEAASHQADCYMAAIVGVAGLRPTLEAVKRGTRIALANKECLVSAGTLFLNKIADANAELIPVDSEHSAAYQSLMGAKAEDIQRVILTASGGPFRSWSHEQMAHATPKDALRHPTWNMGQKISIDSATMMNKALELIEAYHLFPLRPAQLEVIIHPQSIIHCLVEYIDGSTLAQLSAPDMRTPIAYSLSWPARMKTPTRPLDVKDLASMTFEEPDETRFPALRLAKQVLNEGDAAGTIFNAANEVAVEAFLSGHISFMSITQIVESTLESAINEIGVSRIESIEDVIAIDIGARRLAERLIREHH